MPASIGPLACAITAAVTAVVTDVHAADVLRGSELYARHCASCHGNAGRPVMPGAPDFTQLQGLMKPDPVLLGTIRGGKGAMPAYQGQLRDREILDIVAHLRTLR